MTTTTADLETAPPTELDPLAKLEAQVEHLGAAAWRAVEAAHAARESLNGCRVGAELASRFLAVKEAAQAQHLAVSDWKAAQAALAAAYRKEN